MSMFKYFLVWVVTFVFMSLVDALWHVVIFGKVYSKGLMPMVRMSGEKMVFNIPAVVISQVLFVTGVVFLVLYTVQGINFVQAGLVGAFAGILAISVYGITNYAVFKDWNLTLTILELIWGPIIGGVGGIFCIWMKSLLIK